MRARLQPKTERETCFNVASCGKHSDLGRLPSDFITLFLMDLKNNVLTPKFSKNSREGSLKVG